MSAQLDQDRAVPALRPDATRLVWVDMEMTGLRPDDDRIIEVAVVVTDSRLSIVAQGPVVVVHQDDAVLAGMDKWNTDTHGRSGLTAKVRESKVAEAEAESTLLEFLRAWVPAGASPMCGNSVCQDRRFMARHMPRLESYFHYRNLDVSTIKELARRWSPQVLAGVSKESAHTALSDVRDSIAELRHYRGFMGPLAGIRAD